MMRKDHADTLDKIFDMINEDPKDLYKNAVLGLAGIMLMSPKLGKVILDFSLPYLEAELATLKTMIDWDERKN